MMDVKEVALLIEQYQVAQLFDWPFAERCKVNAVKLVEYQGAVMLRAMQRVAIQRECVAEYPATWWEAVKERFAPAWFLRRCPVKRTRIDMEVLYPRIALPDRDHVVKLRIHQPDDWLPSYTA
jgi:hypothetical protein